MNHCATELFRLALRRGVCDKDFCGECADNAIAICARGASDARMFCLKRGNQQQASFLKRRAVFIHYLSCAKTAREPNDNRLLAAQEDTQTFLFHRRMKAANDGNVCVAQFYREVIGFENEIAGAAIGAEKRERFCIEQVEIAHKRYLSGRGASEKGFEGARIARVSVGKSGNIHFRVMMQPRAHVRFHVARLDVYPTRVMKQQPQVHHPTR